MGALGAARRGDVAGWATGWARGAGDAERAVGAVGAALCDMAWRARAWAFARAVRVATLSAPKDAAARPSERATTAIRLEVIEKGTGGIGGRLQALFGCKHAPKHEASGRGVHGRGKGLTTRHF